MQKLRVKKLHPDAVLPKYQSKGASGFDFVAVEDVRIGPGETKVVSTGISLAIEEGFEVQVRPRSGLTLKTTLRVANTPGTIDSDFRGPVGIIMTNSLTIKDNKDVIVKKGDRIAQGVIVPVVQAEITEVDSLDETERGSGGFGSTGSKG